MQLNGRETVFEYISQNKIDKVFPDHYLIMVGLTNLPYYSYG